MPDNRKTTRHRVLKVGSILLDRDRVFSCKVRDISETGACLEFAIPLDIPDDFTLLIVSDGIRRTCNVRWRKGVRIGVDFS
jgi:hypothetical protein